MELVLSLIAAVLVTLGVLAVRRRESVVGATLIVVATHAVAGCASSIAA